MDAIQGRTVTFAGSRPLAPDECSCAFSQRHFLHLVHPAGGRLYLGWQRTRVDHKPNGHVVHRVESVIEGARIRIVRTCRPGDEASIIVVAVANGEMLEQTNSRTAKTRLFAMPGDVSATLIVWPELFSYDPDHDWGRCTPRMVRADDGDEYETHRGDGL